MALRSPDEVLLSDVSLELVGGLDLGRVDLCYVGDSGAAYLRFDAEFSGDRAPLTLLFPVEGGVMVLSHGPSRVPADDIDDHATRRLVIRGIDGASVPFELPPKRRLKSVSATYYVFSVVVELEHEDGRLDVLDVGLDWDGWDIDATLLYRRLGPAWMGLFGRETLEEVGPIEARLARVDDVGGRRLWIGQTDRAAAPHSDAAP